MKCRDLLYISFRESRVLKRPQALNSDNELQDGLIFLNQQINYWAARDCYAWTTTFTAYKLTANHHPTLIGPGLTAPDFDSVGMRPTRIVSGSVILDTTNPPVDVPMNIRDNAWWAANRTKTITSNVPTDLYYQTNYPNGELYFWPVPSYPYGVRLEGNVLLQEFTSLDQDFIAPQAYQAALTLTLAEELVDIWGTEMPGNLARRAMKAREALQSNNNLPPRIATADWGTFSRAGAPDFNYETGTIPNL
jgi:hypothetical protein